MYYWMANSSPPWFAYRALMECLLVALDKRPGVRPVRIGETLRRAITKLVGRAKGGQAKTACWSLQLCAGLEAYIEGETHAVAQRRWERNLQEPERGVGQGLGGRDNGGIRQVG